MMRNEAAALIISALLLSSGAWSRAQPADNPVSLTLPDVVALALDKSPDRQISAADVAAAHVGTRLARTALLPQLGFDETVTRGNDPVYAFGTRLRQRQFSQADFDLNNLNRPLPIGDFTSRFSGNWTAFDSWHTELAIRRSDLLLEGAQAAACRADQEIVYRVVTAYETLLMAEKQLELERHEVETANALLEASASHVRAGMAVDSDRLSAATNLAARQQEIIAAEGDLAIAWAELERATGSPIPEPQRRLQALIPKHFEAPLLADAISSALRTRPDRQSLGRQVEAERTAVKAAKSSFGPTVGAYGSWETDRTSFAGYGGNGWVAGAELKIDLLPAARREELSAAKIAQERALAVAAAADDQIRLEVTQAWHRQQAASRMVEVDQASVDQSKESLRILRNRYDAGLATVTDLLRAEDAERQSSVSYWQAVSRDALAWADLKFATGTLLPANLTDLE
jgi:outer membrane protein TolC